MLRLYSSWHAHLCSASLQFIAHPVNIAWLYTVHIAFTCYMDIYDHCLLLILSNIACYSLCGTIKVFD